MVIFHSYVSLPEGIIPKHIRVRHSVVVLHRYLQRYGQIWATPHSFTSKNGEHLRSARPAIILLANFAKIPLGTNVFTYQTLDDRTYSTSKWDGSSLKKNLNWEWLRFSAFTKGFNLVLQGGAHFSHGESLENSSWNSTSHWIKGIRVSHFWMKRHKVSCRCFPAWNKSNKRLNSGNLNPKKHQKTLVGDHK